MSCNAAIRVGKSPLSSRSNERRESFHVTSSADGRCWGESLKGNGCILGSLLRTCVSSIEAEKPSTKPHGPKKPRNDASVSFGQGRVSQRFLCFSTRALDNLPPIGRASRELERELLRLGVERLDVCDSTRWSAWGVSQPTAACGNWTARGETYSRTPAEPLPFRCGGHGPWKGCMPKQSATP